ncbi:hypothetical protein MC885_020732, partial [Smutsia gigantea]
LTPLSVSGCISPRLIPSLGASLRVPSCASAGGWPRREVISLAFGGVRAGGLRCSCVLTLALLVDDQLVLLLEHLLEQKTLNPRTLQSLEKTYLLPQQDAEVRHRWCELIVKHKYTKAYRDVERFLLEDQVCLTSLLMGALYMLSPDKYAEHRDPAAMGIYLYGELMVSEDASQQQVARRCFELTKEQMDRSSAEVVAEMLF